MTRIEIIAVVAFAVALLAVILVAFFAALFQQINDVPTPQPGDDPRPRPYDVEKEER